MKSDRKKTSTRRAQLPVNWQDSAWFPPVLARSRRSGNRRPVNWPVQIITDPTVCLGRTVTI